MYSQQRHKRWHLKGSTLVKCTRYINSVWLKALLAFTIGFRMYNNEGEAKAGREGARGVRQMQQKDAIVRGGEERKRESFMSLLSLKRPPFHVSIVIFYLFSVHLPHLPPHDKNTTLLLRTIKRKVLCVREEWCIQMKGQYVFRQPYVRKQKMHLK